MKNMYYIDRTNSLTNKIKSTVGVYNKIIRDLSTELDRLEESEEYYRKGFAELHKRIDEAIDYIEHLKNEWNECSVKDNVNLYMFETYLDGITKMITIKEILKGVDEE